MFTYILGKPSVILSPSYSVELAETTSIKCFAIGFDVSYQWIIGSGSFPSKVTGIYNNTLVIPDVRSSDENLYTCVVTTSASCASSDTTQLIVTGIYMCMNHMKL